MHEKGRGYVEVECIFDPWKVHSACTKGGHGINQVE